MTHLPGQAEVSYASLAINAGQHEARLAELSAEEHARAQRYHYARDSYRFVAARARLRALLGQRLRMPARDVPLRYGPAGKPELDPSAAAGRLQFSVSHSGDVAAFAFAWDRAVGVDIERISGDFDLLAVGSHVCSASELAELQRLDVAGRGMAFFAMWTRKEACLKAQGRAIHDEMASLDTTGWIVTDVPAPAGHAAAVAIQEAQ